MSQPEVVPLRGREKWGDVAFDLLLAALGTALVWGVVTRIPAEAVAVQALALYTAYAVLVGVARAVARAATSHLPGLRPAHLGAEPALRVRAWPGDWWHAGALDLGLGVLGCWLGLTGARVGGEWLVPGLLVALTGAWFLVRVALALVGLRRNEALWLTHDALVLDSAAGRVRLRRDGREVAARGVGRRLVVESDELDQVSSCPRLWCAGRRRHRPGVAVLDTSGTGHRADTLADWLRGEARSEAARPA